MEITILCKVVDNFGDIGVMFRIAKQFLVLSSELSAINIVIDNLSSFNLINNQINPKKEFQKIGRLNIYDWNAYEKCYSDFKENDGEKLSVILELFQCGRPDWMEKILFEDKLERTVNIIMVDYLTAEQYAEDFHCLKSLTRSAKVQKVNFMPGFTSKTGGLTIGQGWEELSPRNPDGPVLVFTYERNWTPLTNALKNSKIPVHVAQGRGLESFTKAWGTDPGLTVLEYMNQTEWDDFTKSCSVLFIRGEESMSRACLSGIPFVWHAYPQSDEYQMVKVNALLDRMRRHFKSEDFSIIEAVWQDFNNAESSVNPESMEKHINEFLQKRENLVYGFKDFAIDLRKNGDLCANLMTFIKKITIIE